MTKEKVVKVLQVRCNETTYKSLQCICQREKITLAKLLRMCLDYGIMHLYTRSEIENIEYKLAKEFDDRLEYPERYVIYDK